MDRETIQKRRDEFAAERERLRTAFLRLDGAIAALDQLLTQEAPEHERLGETEHGSDDGGHPG